MVTTHFQTTLHFQLLGKEPTEEQAAFYAANALGFLDEQDNGLRFVAVYVRALMLLWDNSQKLVFFVPPSIEGIATQRFKVLTKHILSHIKSNKELFDPFCGVIPRIGIGGRIFGEDPQTWVAYGFGNPKILPNWMAMRMYNGV